MLFICRFEKAFFAKFCTYLWAIDLFGELVDKIREETNVLQGLPMLAIKGYSDLWRYSSTLSGLNHKSVITLS